VDSLSKRLAALSPRQRELLALRARKSRPDLVIPRESGFSAPGTAARNAVPAPAPGEAAARAIGFSLMFFSSDGSQGGANKYRLLLECARFADRRGFDAVWTPERHFQNFGGLFPNPSVLSAALAMITEHVEIRAGSLVLPLHNPIRVAEDWLLLDNLSGGRVGLSLASGWHPSDFALAPEAYAERRRLLEEGIETIRRIWSEGKITTACVGGGEAEITVLPRPLRPMLPLWITTSGTLATWAKAGELNANILSGLQGDPEIELAPRIEVYRRSRREHGHDPAAGKVTVMLHTFLGSDLDVVRDTVRGPMVRYLKFFIAQGKNSLDATSLGVEPSALSDRDQEDLAAFAFTSFFEGRSLLGTPESCAPLIRRLKSIGVNEVACLLDFGLAAEAVMDGLPYLDRLRREHNPATALGGGA
jgi:natural product biosynthesis luciferase-like monooxygenase protein